jgi:CDP-glucose 4,6-dehydratase
VLVTGATGFVGSWLTYLLRLHEAEVVGLSLPVPADLVTTRASLTSHMLDITCDVANYATVLRVMEEHRPEVIFHLAAQALVLPGYERPLATFATNIMGTAHVLEAARATGCASCCVVVTSDKCYATFVGNGTREHPETDPLGGDDPYSASKAAAELVANSYLRSFGGTQLPALATARAGNIIGGGDWAPGRIVPDWARSVRTSAALHLRHPGAVRPWQHVLDAISGYILLADALLASPAEYSGAWNFGPPSGCAVTVFELVEMLQDSWAAHGADRRIDVVADEQMAVPQPSERHFLALDSSKSQGQLGWVQVLDLATSVEWTTEWYAAALSGRPFDAAGLARDQITRYMTMTTEAHVSTGLKVVRD